MKKTSFLFFIIFIEGYVVLSAELLTIRQIVPYVGSGTETVSIIITAVLLPLALGYYAGGKFKPRYNFKGQKITIRRKLLRNILISTIFLMIGLSFVFIHDFFNLSFMLINSNRLLATSLYAIIFIVFPVFLLAQTIPLTSNFFKKEGLSVTTGKILFFSTLGSLMGAIFSTLVLMATIGVNATVTVTILCLCFLYTILSEKFLSKQVLFVALLAVISIYMNGGNMLKKANILQNNKYNTIQISEHKDGNRVMVLNNAAAAGFNENGTIPFPYMDYFEQNFIVPIQDKGEKKSILVIGSGGFTLGLKDKKNDYTFVDIDGNLKDISEQYFIKQKLGPNKKFQAMPARAFIQQAINKNEQYDLIVVDAYLVYDIPEHLATKEFFESLKASLKEDGIVTINILASPTFSNAFSVNLDNTLKAVFPNINRDVVGYYNGWEKRNIANVIYSYYNRKYDEDAVIYIDDKRRIYQDKYKTIK